MLRCVRESHAFELQLAPEASPLSVTPEATRMEHAGRSALRGTSTGVVWLGRAGYLARGVLYLTMSWLAALAALTHGRSRLADSKGALDEMHQQPFGVAALVLMSIGLSGYGIWRSVQAVLDPAHETSGRWVVAKRGAWLVSALLHFALAAYALSLVRGRAPNVAAQMDARSGAASALAWEPFGPWLLALAGISLVAAGVYELVCAFRAQLDEQLDLSPLSAKARRRIVQLSRFGIAARGVVFAVAGGFLLFAAATSDPQQAKGFGGSLRALREAPFGRVLLGSVALGLAAFGVYQLVEARYRRLSGLQR
jgi:hypothetical protein